MTWFLLNTRSVAFVHTYSGVLHREYYWPRLVPSRYLCFWGERRLGVRLRRAGSHAGKVRRKTSVAIFRSYLPMRPTRLNLTPNLLSPQKHVSSDWVLVC